MKKIIFLLFALLSLGSCNTYYLMSLSTIEKNVIENQDKSLTFKQDSIEVTYKFVDQNGKMIVEILNNSDEIVFVDWLHSAIVVDGISYSLQRTETPINLALDATTSKSLYEKDNDGGKIYETTGTVKGNLEFPSGGMLIAPHSRGIYNPIFISNTYQLNVPLTSLNSKVRLGEHLLRSSSFDENNSTLNIVTYVTVVKEKDKSQIVFKNPFYLSSVIKTNLDPSNFDGYLPAGNNFYFKSHY